MLIILTLYVRSWIKFIKTFLPFFFLFALLRVRAAHQWEFTSRQDWVCVLWEVCASGICPVASSPATVGLWEGILRLIHAWCFLLSWKLTGTNKALSSSLSSLFKFFFFHFSFCLLLACLRGLPLGSFLCDKSAVKFYTFYFIWAALLP